MSITLHLNFKDNFSINLEFTISDRLAEQQASVPLDSRNGLLYMDSVSVCVGGCGVCVCN